jgi:hypothetical protein
MAAQQRQGQITRSPHGGVESVQSTTSVSAAGWQQQRWPQEQERAWEARLRDLQQCICELLIKNQKLRDSLMSATNHQCQEFANGHEHNIKRN